MLYKALGYVKVNRSARVKTWQRIYAEHAANLLIWGVGLFLLFALLFLALVNAALKAVMEP